MTGFSFNLVLTYLEDFPIILSSHSHSPEEEFSPIWTLHQLSTNATLISNFQLCSQKTKEITVGLQ